MIPRAGRGTKPLTSSAHVGIDRERPVSRLCDRCAVIEELTLGASIVVGALIARWWAIVLAIPAGLIAASTFSFEGFSDTEVGVLFGIAVVIGLAIGIAVGKGLRRLARQR